MITKREAAIISAYTGFMLGNFDDMHAYAEEALGHTIFTHMFANKDLCQKLKDAAREDFCNLGVEE